MPVQWVSRPDHTFRGYAGTVATGTVRPATASRWPAPASGATVRRIVTMDGDLPNARAGDAVTLVLAEEVDISRGDVLTKNDPVPAMTDGSTPTGVARRGAALSQPRLSDEAGRATVAATVTRILNRVDINTYEQAERDTLTERCRPRRSRSAPRSRSSRMPATRTWAASS